MKWVNHIAIAGAITALINPALVPVAVIGATAPDWSEWILAKVGHKVKHRTVTHYMASWLGLLVFGLVLWDFRGMIVALALGGFTHVLADSMTVMGVPFSPYSDRRFHLFGGRLRTGGAGEYGIAGAIMVMCLLIAILFKPHRLGNNWYPFFYNWAGLYQAGAIDGKEWKDNRLKFF